MENANEDLSGCALDGHVDCARRSAEAARAHGDPELRGRVRQRDLTPFGPKRLLPVVAFGNGGCRNGSGEFRNFLSDIASHGYLVVAIGPAGDAVVAGSEGRTGQTQASQLLDGVEWATKEHARQGSDYFGKVDVSNVAVMGQSCGTRQALEVSGDPRVKTTVLLNGGPGLGGGRGRGDVRRARQDEPPLCALRAGDAARARRVTERPALWPSSFRENKITVVYWQGGSKAMRCGIASSPAAMEAASGLPVSRLISSFGEIATAHDGPCGHTRSHRPWSVVVSLEFPTQKQAVIFEKYLKSGSGRAFAKRHFGGDKRDKDSPRNSYAMRM